MNRQMHYKNQDEQIWKRYKWQNKPGTRGQFRKGLHILMEGRKDYINRLISEPKNKRYRQKTKYICKGRQIDGQSVLYPLEVSRIEPTLTNNIPVLTQLETKPHAPTACYLKTRRLIALYCGFIAQYTEIYIYILACFLKSFTVQQPSLFWYKIKDFFFYISSFLIILFRYLKNVYCTM